MKLAFGNSHRKTRPFGNWMMALAALLVLMAPPARIQAQIPEPGPPKRVGIFCPRCNDLILEAQIPRGICPHCGYSLKPVAATKNNPTRPPLKPINPFANSLFTNGPVTAPDGRLKPVHFDQDGLAARAEAWGQQMKQLDAQSRQRLETNTLAFEAQKQSLLHSRSNGTAWLQLKNTYADGWDASVVDLRDAKERKVESLKNNSDGRASGVPAFGAANEYQQIRAINERAKYSHMSPGELDAIARQYPNNPEIQHTITQLKAQNKSRDALGQLDDQLAAKKAAMDVEYDAAAKKGREAASTALSLTTPVPGGTLSALYGDKTWAELAGVDAASYGIQEGIKDKSVGILEKSGLKTPVSDFLENGKAGKLPIGGASGVVGGLTAIPDLVEFHDSAKASATHFVAAKELNTEIDAAGGTDKALNQWSTANDKALATSAELDRLLQAEKKRNQTTNAP